MKNYTSWKVEHHSTLHLMAVRDFYNNFSHKWIGRRGPIERPLPPCYVSLWGCEKSSAKKMNWNNKYEIDFSKYQLSVQFF